MRAAIFLPALLLLLLAISLGASDSAELSISGGSENPDASAGGDRHVLGAAEDPAEDKRARGFLGKRARGFLGKRARGFLGKRARGFLGKRARGFLGKRARGFLGKRARGFLGKRARGFLGKRARGFLGKRARGFLGKRARGFLGKRRSEHEEEGDHHQYSDELDHDGYEAGADNELSPWLDAYDA